MTEKINERLSINWTILSCNPWKSPLPSLKPVSAGADEHCRGHHLARLVGLDTPDLFVVSKGPSRGPISHGGAFVQHPYTQSHFLKRCIVYISPVKPYSVDVITNEWSLDFTLIFTALTKYLWALIETVSPITCYSLERRCCVFINKKK